MSQPGNFNLPGLGDKARKQYHAVYHIATLLQSIYKTWDWLKKEMTSDERKTSAEYDMIRRNIVTTAFTDQEYEFAISIMIRIAIDGWDKYVTGVKESAEWSRKMREMEKCYGDDW